MYVSLIGRDVHNVGVGGIGEGNHACHEIKRFRELQICVEGIIYSYMSATDGRLKRTAGNGLFFNPKSEEYIHTIEKIYAFDTETASVFTPSCLGKADSHVCILHRHFLCCFFSV